MTGDNNGNNPGREVYLFTPVMITIDPASGQELRIHAGGPVQVTVMVSEDAGVRVRIS
jgi:hypothetical protein